MSQRPLILTLISFVGGILVGHGGLSQHPALLFPTGVMTAFALIASLFMPVRLKFPLFILLFFLLGIFLHMNKSHRASDLSPLAIQREKVIIEGTVLEPAKVGNGMARFAFRSDRLVVRGQGKTIRGKLLVTVYNHPKQVTPGEKIRFPARLRPFSNFNIPGAYDYVSAMRLRGLECGASVSDGRQIVSLGRGRLGFPLEILEKLRRPIRSFFRENLSPGNEAVFRALILGEKQAIHSDLRDSFNMTGLGHILAVSGLHVGLVAWLAFSVLKKLLSLSYRLMLRTDIRKLAAILTCFPVVAYAGLAGFHVSSQRAMIMALAYLFSIILGREKEIWSTCALAALVVLSLDPFSLFSISFQLSFCAVVGILWLAPRIYKWISAPLDKRNLGGKGSPLVRISFYFAGLTSVTLSAMIILLPLISYYFHRVSLVALPANLSVMPVLGFWVIPFGLMSVLSLPISHFVADLSLELGAWGLDVMVWLVQFWAHFPWAALWVITPNFFEILLYYCFIFTLFSLRRWSWAKWAFLFTLFVFAADASYWIYQTRFNPHLRVTYLDVGQGSSTLIQFPGQERMLIDGGGFPRGNFDVGRMVVAPFLLHSKIRRIDYLVLTHPQADHMNGLRFISSQFHPREFWHNGASVEGESYSALMKNLDLEGTKKLGPSDLRGGREISGVKVEILHPFAREEKGLVSTPSRGLNDQSLVLKLSYSGKTFLFPGDLGKEGEKQIVSRTGTLLKSDVLLAPHHGSRSSSSKEFLQKVKPRFCVISSGRGNQFGFPHIETLERFDGMSCRVIRIDQVGNLQFSVGQNRIKISSFLKGPM